MLLTYVPMHADEVDMAGLGRVNERYRTEVVGPPLAPGR